MSNAHEFETSLAWSGAKKGILSAPELTGVDVASPPAFGGAPGLWTPEHMFVGSANVCVMMTFLAIAELSKLAMAFVPPKVRLDNTRIDNRGPVRRPKKK